MPRKRKKKGRGSGARQGRNEAIASFWSRALRNAIKAKADYTKEAEDTLKYFGTDHRALFEEEEIRERVLDATEGVAVVSVPKAAQAKNSLGPQLYLVNPTRTVVSRSNDSVMVAMARVLKAYLNYTPKEGGLAKEFRAVIDDALLRGRGFVGAEWDETLGIVTSRAVESTEVLIDPDYCSMDKAKWIAVRKRMPLWELKRETPHAQRWRLNELEPSHVAPSAEHDDEFGETINPDNSDVGPTNDLVEYWTVYSKMGCGLRGSQFAEGFERYADEDDFVRLDVAINHRVPLSEGEWEVPLYLDRDWPLVQLDLVETPGQLWPVSIMGQVKSLQKALDLNATIGLNGVKQHGKVIVLGDSSLDSRVQEAIRSGSMSEFVGIKLQPHEKLSDKFQVLDLGQISPEVMGERLWLENQIDVTTGVTTMVSGAPESTAQDRSATASRQRGSATGARVGSLRNLVLDAASKNARQEGIAVRTLLDPEDVSPYVPSEKIGMFLVSAEVFGGVEVPIRDRRTPAERESDDRSDREPPMTMEYLCPPCARYYASFEEAAEGMVGMWEEIQASSDPRVIEVATSMGEPDPQLGIPPGLTVRPVTVEDVWRDTAGMSPNEIMREFGQEITAGSMARLDKDREIDLVENDMAQIFPVAVQTMNEGLANALIENRQRVLEVPEELRLPPIQLAPPQPQGAPA